MYFYVHITAMKGILRIQFWNCYVNTKLFIDTDSYSAFKTCWQNKYRSTSWYYLRWEITIQWVRLRTYGKWWQHFTTDPCSVPARGQVPSTPCPIMTDSGLVRIWSVEILLSVNTLNISFPNDLCNLRKIDGFSEDSTPCSKYLYHSCSQWTST